MAFLSASRIKAALAGQHFKPDLAFVRYTLREGGISVDAVEELLSGEEVESAEEEVVVDILLAMDRGREAVLAVLDENLSTASETTEGVTANAQSRLAWWGVLVRDILLSGLDTTAALSRIAAIWADLGYPSEWEPFIHYLPGSDISGAGPEGVIDSAHRWSSTWTHGTSDDPKDW